MTLSPFDPAHQAKLYALWQADSEAAQKLALQINPVLAGKPFGECLVALSILLAQGIRTAPLQDRLVLITMVVEYLGAMIAKDAEQDSALKH